MKDNEIRDMINNIRDEIEDAQAKAGGVVLNSGRLREHIHIAVMASIQAHNDKVEGR